MNRNLIIQGGILLCGLLFLITSSNISRLGFNGDVLNQRDYVIVLSWLLIIFSIGGIIREYLLNRSVTKEEKTPQETMKPEANTTIKTRIVLSMVLLFLFVLGFTFIGYYVSSFVFVFLITWLMFDWEKKKWLASLLFSIMLNGALYILFSFIDVYFPKTLLF